LDGWRPSQLAGVVLLGCGQFRDLPGQPGREPERRPAVDRFPSIGLAQLSPPFLNAVGLTG
jgi:hypothetical protein